MFYAFLHALLSIADILTILLPCFGHKCQYYQSHIEGNWKKKVKLQSLEQTRHVICNIECLNLETESPDRKSESDFEGHDHKG